MEIKTPRLDADGTAKPLTRIVGHPNRDHCVGPGIPPVRPEYEAEDGTRTPLGRPEPAPRRGRDMTIADLVEQVRRVANTDSSDGQWIGNMRDDAMAELARLGLTWRTGPGNEYLRLTARGEDLLALAGG